MGNASDVISLSQLRNLIQDNPKPETDFIEGNGNQTIFPLTHNNISKDYPPKVTIDSIEKDDTEYTMYWDIGEIEFYNAPYGNGRINYKFTQLSNEALETCLDNALNEHDPSCSWGTVPPEYLGFIKILAASKAYFMLASRWATRTRVVVEDTEIDEDKIAKRYFELGDKMLQQYKDANAGVIDVETVTRRNLETGKLIQKPEDVY